MFVRDNNIVFVYKWIYIEMQNWNNLFINVLVIGCLLNLNMKVILSSMKIGRYNFENLA